MEKTNETSTIALEELEALYDYLVSFYKSLENNINVKNTKVLAKNHGYFNPVLSEKYALGDWIDLKAGKTVRMKKGEYINIPLGVAMKLPQGYEAHVIPRPSTFRKYHIIMTNTLEIIDNAYCDRNDEWCFPAYAVEDTVITRGDRIAQFRIVRNQQEIEFVEVEDLTDSDRNGFGSSGVR